MKHEHACENSDESWHIEWDGSLWWLQGEVDGLQITFCPFCGERLEE